MAIRMFIDREGNDWNAWLVRPSMGEDSPLQARYKEGWICFQRTDGSERCRLTLDEVPPGWEALPAERLDLLRRVAAQPVNGRTATATTEEVRNVLREDAERGVVSGPRQRAARDDA